MKGIYALCIIVDSDICIKVGALGNIFFQRGLYVYVGSALNSMDPRLLRHLSKSEGNIGKIHWHIDYLLINDSVSITNIFVKETLEKEECVLADFVGRYGVSIHNFGSSDCDCDGHLFKVKNTDFLEGFGLVKWSRELNLTS